LAYAYQPLRIPSGWLIQLNWLLEHDPAAEAEGELGGSSLFAAYNEYRRFWIDVSWQPEFDPNGSYQLVVEYAPWQRTAAGRRRKDIPPHQGDAEVVHQFETRSHAELVRELEHWLRRCAAWQKEGS
jgi:hypothetical protein